MNPTNTFFIGNGGIVQLDDVLISMAGNARKNPGGDEPDDPKLKEEKYFASLEIPASTLRFSFGDLNYDPTKDETVASKHNTTDRAGGGTPAGYGGTWRKLNTRYTNIWDYTYRDNTLLSEWDNGSFSYETTPATRFWSDVEHNPIKIIASNTTGCTSFQRAFQGCWAITEIWELDTSSSESMRVTFQYCKNLRRLPDVLDFSNVQSNGLSYTFTWCQSIEEINHIILPFDSSLSISADCMFEGCLALRKINHPLNFISVTSAPALFALCSELMYISLDNTSRITTLQLAFACCNSLPIDSIAVLDTSSCKNFTGVLNGSFVQMSSGHVIYSKDVDMDNITYIPTWQFSAATNMNGAFTGCNIQAIDANRLSTLHGSVNVNSLFKDNRKCNSGILDAYELLRSISSNNVDCFLNCGMDSDTGYLELEKVPVSWGGLKEE